MRRLRRVISWLRFVVQPQRYPSRWQDRLFRGHVSIGPVTVYGANAMHWAINVWALGHYWCWHPTTRTFGGYWPWYFYLSTDATPSKACYLRRGRRKKSH
jgi:hypothetical protein